MSMEGTLEQLDWPSVNRFLSYCHTNVLGPASGLSNVGGGCLGRGPIALYGLKKGMAFTRNKGPSKNTISNEEMGRIMVAAEQSRYPSESVETITKRLFLSEERKTRETAVAKLRESSQTAIAAILARINPSVLLMLNNNCDFVEASRGSCLVTLVEHMLKLAANSNRNPKSDQREAIKAFELVKMSDDIGFYSFKHTFELGVNRCEYAGCKLDKAEIIEQAVFSLSDKVFPNVKRDHHRKTGDYSSLTDLNSLWAVLEKEYDLHLKFQSVSSGSNDIPILNLKEAGLKLNMFEGGSDTNAFVAAVGKLTSVADKLTEAVVGTKRSLAHINNSEGSDRRARPVSSPFCHNYATHGRCYYGDKCKFEHAYDVNVLRKGKYEPRDRDFWEFRARDRDRDEDRDGDRNGDGGRDNDRNRVGDRNGDRNREGNRTTDRNRESDRDRNRELDRDRNRESDRDRNRVGDRDRDRETHKEDRREREEYDTRSPNKASVRNGGDNKKVTFRAANMHEALDIFLSEFRGAVGNNDNTTSPEVNTVDTPVGPSKPEERLSMAEFLNKKH